eukprot:10360444-Lingulodinium_polyedra.AAC.1
MGTRGAGQNPDFPDFAVHCTVESSLHQFRMEPSLLYTTMNSSLVLSTLDFSLVLFCHCQIGRE